MWWLVLREIGTFLDLLRLRVRRICHSAVRSQPVWLLSQLLSWHLLASPYFFRTKGLCCSGTSVRGFARVSALSITSGNPNLYWSRTSQVCLVPNHRSQERISVTKIRAWAVFSALGSFDLSLGHRNPCSATCCPSMMPDWYQQAHISELKASVPCSFPMRTVYVPLTEGPSTTT
ncbi:hypothetical protein BJX65DRAFT_265544 [Aspergillus insuetus]